MALQLMPPSDQRPVRNDGPRVLASGAPPSPGPVPSDLARHLVFGEALVWWGDKDRIYFGPLLMVLLALVSVLGFVSVFAPEFWLQSPGELAKPLAALLSPAALVLLRERLNQRAVMVTDGCILDVDREGHMTRLPFDKIREVRRDVIRGGVRLESGNTSVIVPAPLADDARQAIASQMRHRSVARHSELNDPLGWMP